MIRPALLLSFALQANLALAAAPPLPEKIEILAAEFGLFEDSRPGELDLVPTTVVPRKQGQRYGWVIELRTRSKSVAVREEYLLPTPAAAAGKSTPPPSDPLSESLQVDAQRRHQVSQRQLIPVDGRIYGEWSIGPKEPPGPRHLQVVVEGQVAARFKYEVK